MTVLPASACAPLLRTAGLSKRFGGVVALDGLDLELYPGETVGVIGPNGAGKSTLVSLLSGALRPSSGEVFFEGRRVTGLPPHRRARLGIGRTYQIPQPFHRMTVLENLLLGRLYGARGGGREAKRECLAVLERTGLLPLAHAPAGDLTLLGLKRLELARALALKPRVLLLDEIGAGLVEAELAELIDLIRSLQAEVEAILVVEHVIDLIRGCSDRVVVLDWGKKIAEGALDDVLSDAQVAAVYLGTGAGTAVQRAPGRAASTEEPLVSVRHVAAAYGSFRALHDVSFDIYPGEIVALLGANGAGKTTTARVLSGMLPPTAGEVLFKGQRIDGRPAHEIVRMGVAHCMEGRRIFTDLTVEENLLLGGRAAPTGDELRRRLQRVYALFPVLEERSSDSGGNLSGGQQQMLAIGRALMADPELIIFDELSLGLAPVAVDAIYEKIAELHAQGVTMLLIEQNVERGLALADRAYVLERGVVALSGRPEEIRDDPRLVALYVGEAKGDT